ncbi:hypothetical protein MSAN_00210700 [Mycena sanguinolenta]|uniref:Uncharacterized protein n=1 Tax=Mycena sanguinolenta TaxID=230812 RepID=A0A8H6ZK52_9AGAR|nr:hypothetical protein MSAN_00210700 [Mycena sanguinolenta]
MAEGGSGGRDITSFSPGILFSSFTLTSRLHCKRKMCDVCTLKTGNLNLDDVPFDMEPVPQLPTTPPASTSGVTSSPAVWEGLTGAAPKKAKRRARDTTLQQADATKRASSDEPPPPKPIAVTFALLAWAGLTQEVQHPHLARWRDTDFLKKYLNYFEWDGRCVVPSLFAAAFSDLLPQDVHPFVESKGRIVGALIGAPKDPTWVDVVKRASETVRREYLSMSFPSAAYKHRRGHFAQRRPQNSGQHHPLLCINQLRHGPHCARP